MSASVMTYYRARDILPGVLKAGVVAVPLGGRIEISDVLDR